MYARTLSNPTTWMLPSKSSRTATKDLVDGKVVNVNMVRKLAVCNMFKYANTNIKHRKEV